MSKGYEFRSGFESYWISAELVDALEEYVRIGRPLGSFLQAVVSNDFKDAVGRADGTNIRNLPAFAAYVYNEMPGPSQGSREKYKAWILMHAEKRALEAAENAATGNAPGGQNEAS